MVCLVSNRSRILSLLAFALLVQSAWSQRLGPLRPDTPPRSKASSAERKEEVRPPSLQLSLPPPAAIDLPPLDPEDLRRLPPRPGRPPRIGVHRRLPEEALRLSFSPGGGVKSTAEGAWRSTEAGRLWRLKITSPGARAMRVHFQDFAIGSGRLWLHAADGQTVGPYTGSGLYGDGDFWSGTIFGDGLTIEYLPDPATEEDAVPFRIAAISHVWHDAFGVGSEGGAHATKTIPRVERSTSLQQLRPKAATELISGQPAAFSLGPVDDPALFSGDNSYRLEVPAGATRVTFRLESVDPDVDVDLHVRHGLDNDLRGDGSIISDHSSGGLTGDEKIAITHRSNPPLRAGTYFVSLLLHTTGVVAEGTLTATVETDAVDCHLDVTCYPEWSNAAAGVAHITYEEQDSTSICSGTLLNNSQQDGTPYFLTAAHCVQTDEAARTVEAYWFYQTPACGGEPPSRRSVPRTAGARLLATTGYGEYGQPEGDMTLLLLADELPDRVMFQGWDADPQPAGTMVTGIHHPGSEWGVFKRISFGSISEADPTYALVYHPLGRGYTEPGSSGSALFSSAGTVVGALSGGQGSEDACSIDQNEDDYTHFSVFYPQIQQFIDPVTGMAPLTPGQPAAFSLGAVDDPALFSGDNSYRLEVPAGATRVTFRLESVDPDVDVDLYVRYGEDNDIRGDGSIISDYRSEGPTGNEQIVITHRSDPPLRAGTYFVSLALHTTGFAAEGRLTAMIDFAPAGGEQTYYFPHLAVGAGWQTTITYINYSQAAVDCRTEFISDQGTPLTVSFPSLGRVSGRTDALPPGGSVHEETDVGLRTGAASGWARAACSAPVKASLLFRRYDSQGAPAGEAAVNAAAMPATRFVTFAEQKGQFGTGVAYANPSSRAAQVTFRARDEAGRTRATAGLTLEPGAHGAQNMVNIFGLRGFTGSLEITSSEPIVTLSINFEADPVFSSLPPGEIDGPP